MLSFEMILFDQTENQPRQKERFLFFILAASYSYIKLYYTLLPPTLQNRNEHFQPLGILAKKIVVSSFPCKSGMRKSGINSASLKKHYCSKKFRELSLFLNLTKRSYFQRQFSYLKKKSNNILTIFPNLLLYPCYNFRKVSF